MFDVKYLRKWNHELKACNMWYLSIYGLGNLVIGFGMSNANSVVTLVGC